MKEQRVKKYVVKIPNPNHDGITVLERMEGSSIVLSQYYDYFTNWEEQEEFQLTEEEINSDFSWAFRWAKPVSEEANDDTEV